MIRWILLAGALGLVVLYAILWVPKRAAIRYRLVVEVDTPQGLRTGASVIDVVRAGPIPLLGPMSVGGDRVDGEAVIVDLPGGKPLFALLRGKSSDYAGVLPSDALRKGNPYPPFSERYRAAQWKELYSEARRTKPVVQLPTELYPTLAAFDDIADPRTVEEVDPDGLAAAFGPGIKLRRIEFEVTDEPVTRRIKQRPPWLGTTTKGYLSGAQAGGGPALADRLDTQNFIQGTK